jgi:hypothetical protein
VLHNQPIVINDNLNHLRWLLCSSSVSALCFSVCVCICVAAVRICVAASVFAFVLQQFAFVLQHLCSHWCCSVCVSASVFLHLFSIHNRLPSMTTLTICVSFAVAILAIFPTKIESHSLSFQIFFQPSRGGGSHHFYCLNGHSLLVLLSHYLLLLNLHFLPFPITPQPCLTSSHLFSPIYNTPRRELLLQVVIIFHVSFCSPFLK